MKKILVPTDFSKNALKAVLYAAEIAKRYNATIYLLHILEAITGRIHQPYDLHEKLEEEIVSNRENELATLQKSIAISYPDVKIQKEVIKGTVTNSIAEFAGNNEIDLIVMGTKGATGLRELLMGSVATATIDSTKIPVLAIPDEYDMEEPDGILFATNSFEENKLLLNTIVDLAKLFSAVIYVTVFIDTDSAEAVDYINYTQKLSQYVEFLQKAYPGVSFKSELIDGTEFEKTIEKYHDKNGADIMAMITYRKGFWERFFKKSITKKMASHSKIPLLAIPG